MKWKLEPYGRGGGISGEGVKNLLEATGFKTREDLIVREACQNSVDAHDDVKEHKVRIVFRKVSLKGKQKQQFVQLLALGELANVDALLKTTPKDSPLRTLDDGSALDLLFIEDFNTKGLGGGLADLSGNYYRLLFLIGDAMKAEIDDDLGGSYGFGKSVYSSNSTTSTIVTYSVFKADAKTDGAYARLLGSTFQKAFTHKGQGYTGRGWFGGAKVEDGVPDPIVDEAALDLAEKLGFAKRTKKDLGTSILLIGTRISGEELDTDKLRAAIETWWWPRYIEDRLDVELYEGAKLMPPPRPKQRPDLAPYIDCFSQIGNGGTTDVAVSKFNAHPGTKLQMGSIALKAVSEDLFGERSPDEPGPGARRVAMMRGPLMVVDYHTFGTERREPFVGVYRATPDINTYLKLSEPKEHHRWDPKARRLQAKQPGSAVVESVMRRCNFQVRVFQASLAPKKEQPRERLEVLDKILGAAFAALPGAPGRRPGERTPPKYGKAIVEFPNGITRVKSGSAVRLQAEVRMKLKSTEESPQKVELKAHAAILEDANRVRGKDEGDSLVLDILDVGTKKQLAKGKDPSAKVTLSSDKWHYFRVSSDDYNGDWFAELQITVE